MKESTGFNLNSSLLFLRFISIIICFVQLKPVPGCLNHLYFVPSSDKFTLKGGL